MRIAIGWHFFNEGLEKVGPILNGEKGFSSEGYLRNATGPLAPYFRNLIPDVNGLDRLDPGRLKAAWRADVDRISEHFGFNKTQRGDAEKILADSEQYADAWFGDREQTEKRLKYFRDLHEVQQIEQNRVPLPDGRTRVALSYERERAAAKRKELDADRVALLKDLDARGAALREAVVKLADEPQVASAGAYAPPKSSLEKMNLFISISVLAIGFCLMVGVFTRLAALGGAALPLADLPEHAPLAGPAGEPTS